MLAKKIFFFLFLLPFIAFSQSDSAIVLKQIEINSIRSSSKLIGFKEQLFDSITLNQKRDLTVSELLNEQSPLYIKNYGPGALSTISLRGGSSYHTTILWNGFALANPMNGVMDLHLLPIFLFENISLQYGGASTTWGSGAISGALHLNDHNTFNQNNSLKLGTRYCDASGFQSFGEAHWQLKKISSTLKFFQTNETNHFSFQNNGILSKQTHAEYNGYGVISENTYLINSHSFINLNFWHQFANRNLAPVLTEAISSAIQRDNNLRYSLIYSWSGKSFQFVLRNAYFNEHLFYNDASLAKPSSSICKTFISEPELKYHFNKNNSFHTGINFSRIEANTLEFIKKVIVQREGIFFSYEFQKNNFKTSVSARKEFSNLNNAPMTYSFGIENAYKHWLNYSGNFSSVYRNPQVNDLYWNPGGNINLLPETGFSEELNLKFNLLEIFKRQKNDSTQFAIEVTGFNKNIDNWIIWMPHGSFWSPLNIRSVHSYGTESALHFRRSLRTCSFTFNLFYSYTISETSSSTIANDPSLKKQLIYVPIHKGGIAISFSWKNSTLSTSYSYNGNCFTTSDNLDFLPSYSLINFQVNHQFYFKQNSIDFFIRIANVTNSNYTAVKNRPEPLRNYSLGVTLQLFQNK